MNARSSWGAKDDRRSDQAADDDNLPLDDLLDARFDDEGRLSQIGRGSRQRIAERLDPRPPALSADELERAVQKLSQGLEAIERQGRGRRAPEARTAQPPRRSQAGEASGARDRDFVTYSLDRLEARLEALSQRLQQRAGAPANAAPAEAETRNYSTPEDRWESDPTFAVEADEDSEREERLRAEEESARLQAEVEAEERRRAEAEEARIAAEAEEARRREEALEARRQAEAAESARRAAAIDAERRAEAAALRREAEMAARISRQFNEIEMRIEALQKSCDDNQIEPVRGDLLELLQQVEGLGRDGRSVAEALDHVGARLDEMEMKVTAARNMAGNRLGDIQDRLSGLAERLDEVEVEIPGFDAVRENQSAILERFDRMEGIVHRLASPEELFDKVEGLKKQLQSVASQREVGRIEESLLHLADRLDSLPEDLSDRAVLGRIEGQLASLAAELAESRSRRVSAESELDQRLSSLSVALAEVGESGRTPDLSGIEQKLQDVSSRLDEDREAGNEAIALLDRRIAALTAAIEQQEDEAASEILANLTQKIDTLGEAIEAQDAGGTRRGIELLDRKLEQLAGSLAEQAEHLSRAQFEPLETRLDEMQTQLEDLSRRARDSTAQFGPFAKKLDEIASRVTALGAIGAPTPLSTRLASIEERLSGLVARSGDPRSLHTQLENVISRLELLKGRSIDPARLNDLFDRVDSAVRALPEERFDRIERKLDETSAPAERFDRLERKISEVALSAIGEDRFERLERTISDSAGSRVLDERFTNLERKLDDAHGGVDRDRLQRLEKKLDAIGSLGSIARPQGVDDDLITADDLADFRTEIMALRRELRSLPSYGEGETGLGEMLRTISTRLERLPADPPATAIVLEEQIERVTRLLEDPSHSRLALAHIEASLKAIEERLEDTRRSVLLRAPDAEHAGEAETVAELARSLSNDVSALKASAPAAEQKSADALDAVHDTLEAVVKRMAFLERDAERATAEKRTPAEPPSAAPITLETPALVAPAATPVEAPKAPEGERESRDTTSSGLLSRFTSSQLLKRATGGRAESFSPDIEEADDAGDLPLEPGTDAPLASALAGAPSSDTARMSGGRSLARAELSGGSDLVRARGAAAEALEDDDFLSAARRAARAASEEPESREGGRRGGIMGFVKSRRRSLLAAALAVAVAVAAMQIIREQMLVPGDVEVANAPQATEQENAAPATPETVAAAPEAAPPPVESEVATAEVSAPEDVAASTPASEEKSTTPSTAAAPAETPAPAATDTAATPPADAPADVANADLSAAMPEASPQNMAASIPPLPEEIGPATLRDAASTGDPIAAFEVAARYAEGRGVTQDFPAAIGWYHRSAEAGLAPAQYRLGSIYEKGLGVERDLAQAQDWYRRAADAGNVKAMHNLAVLYAEGAGGEPDLEQAAELFRQAAEHGVRDSQFNLAILHARGLGVPQDLIEAYKWFAVAAGSGDEESLRRRDIIAAALNDSDLAKAEAAAAAFQPLPLISEANEILLPDGGWRDDTTSVEAISENDVVALVQKLLAEKGFDPGPPDGLLGRQTIDAITSFQERAGLPRTGQIDNVLVAALQEQPT